MAAKPRLIYFSLRGRADPIRLALAAAGVEYEYEALADPSVLKSDLESYHFGQVPRFVDDEVDICQSTAILKHVARKHGLAGANRAEEARVDEMLEGTFDLVQKLFFGYVLKKDEPGALDKYWDAHWDPATATARSVSPAQPGPLGAHAAFLARRLEASAKSPASSGFLLDSGLSVADIQLAYVLEMHVPVFGRERMEKQYPILMALMDKVHEVPGIAAYINGPDRPEKFTRMW